MTPEQKSSMHKYYKVLINKMIWSDDAKCQIKRCKRHQKYSLFIGESERLSTIYMTCCDKHLPYAAEKTLEERKRLYEKAIADFEKNELEKAARLISEKVA